MAEDTGLSVRVGVEPLRELCLAVMSRAGLREADARLLAEGHLSMTAIPEVVS